MKKVITLVAAIMLLVTSTLALAGCGGTKTLVDPAILLGDPSVMSTVILMYSRSCLIWKAP